MAAVSKSAREGARFASQRDSFYEQVGCDQLPSRYTLVVADVRRRGGRLPYGASLSMPSLRMVHRILRESSRNEVRFGGVLRRHTNRRALEAVLRKLHDACRRKRKYTRNPSGVLKQHLENLVNVLVWCQGPDDLIRELQALIARLSPTRFWGGAGRRHLTDDEQTDLCRDLQQLRMLSYRSLLLALAVVERSKILGGTTVLDYHAFR